MEYTSLTDSEKQIAHAQRKAYMRLREIAHSDADKYDCTLTWEHVKGKECLVQRKKNRAKIIGTRAPHIEEFYNAFNKKKKALLTEVNGLRGRIDQNKKGLNKTSINRVCDDAAKLLRVLDKHKTLGEYYYISGIHCLFAFESLAEIRFKQSISDKDQYDMLQEANRNIVILCTKGSERKLFEYLIYCDDSYKVNGTKNKYRAINSSGFTVDIICASTKYGGSWMVNVPMIESIAFGEDGMPVPYTCLAPHVYAVYKYWQVQQKTSEQIYDRSTEFSHKQAYAITDMVKKELGKCITDERYDNMPDCITDYKDQLAKEAEDAFGTTYDL